MRITKIEVAKNFGDFQEAFYVALGAHKAMLVLKKIFTVLALAAAIVAGYIVFHEEDASIVLSVLAAIFSFLIVRFLLYLVTEFVFEPIQLHMDSDEEFCMTLPGNISKQELKALEEMRYREPKDWFTHFLTLSVAKLMLSHAFLWITVMYNVPCGIDLVKAEEHNRLLVTTKTASSKEAIERINFVPGYGSYDDKNVMIQLGFDKVKVLHVADDLTPLNVEF